MGWWKPYNVSGTIHIENRSDEFCGVIREVLPTGDIGLLGTFTGAIVIAGQSDLGLFISSGFDLHEFYVLVNGSRSAWMDFANRLEEALTFANLPYSIVVHDRTINQEKKRKEIGEFISIETKGKRS